MKTIALLTTALLSAPALLAFDPGPGGNVPDSGSSAGLIALALVALVAARRKFKK